MGMNRYITKPHARWCDDLECEVAEPGPLVVFEPDGDPQPTGLLDAHGNELYRVSDRRPIGYRPPND